MVLELVLKKLKFINFHKKNCYEFKFSSRVHGNDIPIN